MKDHPYKILCDKLYSNYKSIETEMKNTDQR